MKIGLKELLIPPYLPDNLDELEQLILQKELKAGRIKPDNEARIVWNNPEKKLKTEFSIVYIHGFSSSIGDGKPLHFRAAEYCNANLYLCRLAGHGLAENPMKNTLYTDWIKTAVEAFAIGEKIGQKIIVMGCSTGAALAALIAAYKPTTKALLLYSPLVEFYDWRVRNLPSALLGKLQQWILPNKHIRTNASKSGLHDFEAQYWYDTYPLKAVIELKKLVDLVKKEEPFYKLQMPLLLAYYHKSKTETDHRVHIPTLERIKDIQLSKGSYRFIKNYKDGGYHILTNPFHNKSYDEVEADTLAFLFRILNKI
ncbi:hypothetical protein EP331_01765 [bacterium]|nr:MAG: hypothetical protein EP331_01765 [bacterium]